MDAVELEKQINEKFGTKGNFAIDEKFHLIRTFETDEIVVFDFNKPGNGRHLLKDATKEELEKISNHFKFPDDDENPHIPDVESQGKTGDSEEDDDSFIPD